MQLKQKFSNTENGQLYRLKAIEPFDRPFSRLKAIEAKHLTFCICERHIANQNSVELFVELKRKYGHSIYSQPVLIL